MTHDEFDGLRRLAAGVRSRLNTALKHLPGGWRPSLTVSQYGDRGNPSLRIMLVRHGADGKGLNLAVYWSHDYRNLPSVEQLNDMRYGCRRWKGGKFMEQDIRDISNAHAEVKAAIPMVWAAYRLANPDKLIQMAGEGEWKKHRPVPARKRKRTVA